jgi:predicted nucleotidyltransferase
MRDLTNRVRIKTVARSLQLLNENVVFVGGATVSLYADAASGEARPTDDVDVIIELANYGSYVELEDRLRSVGFANDMESGVICRYTLKGSIVDIMPTDPKVIGFSNAWYPAGYANAIDYAIDDMVIKIFSLPYFIASKMEAFKGRGGKDYRFSSDFEDIVYILENCSYCFEHLKESEPGVKQYLRKEFKEMLANPGFEEGVAAHLDPNLVMLQLPKIKGLIKEFVG